ncbi:hypothetical protein ACVJGC_001030 [Bradyrhizobium diazoefficiens]
MLEHDRERRDALLGDADRAKTVRPQQAHAAVARGQAQPVLHRAALLAELGKARREHDDTADAAGRALFHGLAGTLRIDRDDGEIRCLRHFGDGSIGLQSLHRRGLRVDRIDAACIAVAAQQVDRPTADLGRLLRGADDRDRARRHQRVETFSRPHLSAP